MNSSAIERANYGATRTRWRPWSGNDCADASGFKFRRQHPFGNYIANFYCARAALVVELDGMTHDGREAYDSKREAWLESQGLLVVRIKNHEFLDSYHPFFEALARHCVERTKNKGTATGS